MSNSYRRIPQEIIDEIKFKANIVEIIQEYVPLSKKGNNYMGLCPFHNEKTPSFSVSQPKQFYHCFGCGAGGNVFSFIMEIEHLSFPEAVNKLAKITGVQIPESPISPEEKKKASLRSRYREINQLAAYFYEQVLRSHYGQKYNEYLINRKISVEVSSTYKLGACLNEWDGLSNWLLKKGAKESELVTLGLSVKRTNGRLYDRFRNRLIFPICDEYDHIVGFGGRVIDKSADTHKYLNSPETPLFNKGQILYGLNTARKAIREQDQILITEGYMDVLACHQAGIHNVVAPLGTALTTTQIKKILRHTYHVVLAFDGDTAGQASTMKSIELLEKLGANVRVLMLPDKMDPDEYLKTFGVNEFNKELANSIEGLEFVLQYLSKDFNLTKIENKLIVLDKILPLISYKKNAIEKTHAHELIATELNISTQTVIEEYNHFENDENRKRQQNMTEVNARTEKNEVEQLSKRTALLLALILEKPDRIKKIQAVEGRELFDSVGKGLYDILIERFSVVKTVTVSDIPFEYAGILANLMAVTDKHYQGDTEPYYDKLLLEQRYHYISKCYEEAIQNLTKKDNQGMGEDATVLLDPLEKLLLLKTSIEQDLGRET